MRGICLQTAAMLLGMFCATVVHAQQPAVPKLVRFSGSFRPADGTPSQTMESVTLSVYRDQTGGDVLWHEIQNVAVDANGRYSVLMGATQNEGMPLHLFASGEPRWLGVQFNRSGEAEQPRTLLVSVPYALKAADAETLGGKPASAYLLAAPAVGADTVRESTSSTTALKPKATPANSGQPNFIGKFANTTDLIDSSMYEVNGNVGIFTTAPAISLDVRTGTLPQMGIAGTTDYLTFFASDQFGPAIYWDPAKDMRFGKGGSGLYNPFGFVEQMRIQSSTGNVGIGTKTPGSKLDVAGDINFSGGLLFQGQLALQFPDFQNTALGPGALFRNSGVFNTAIGNSALQFNTTGNDNTATGASALFSNTIGKDNTATGAFTLATNTTGTGNTATGYVALNSNLTGSDNTAIGFSALSLNTVGVQNTANGSQALSNNQSGDQNVAIGFQAMLASTTGSGNTAVGSGALQSNTTGANNLAVGVDAAISVNGGNSNNIHIGTPGITNDNATVRIGNAALQTKFFAAGVRGITTGNNDAIAVVIDSNGQLGTKSSSRRFKEDIEDMGAASYDLMRLRPVTFRYKQPFVNGSKPIQYGLIAEEVAEVYPDLVAHSADGQIETVKYDVLDSLLLNEMQRQQAEIRRLEKKIDEQNQQNQRLQERLNQSLQERLARLEAAIASGESRVPNSH